MIERYAKRRILRSLAEAPAVALLGPRQVGKTTLARDIAADAPDCLYLDLENPNDAARLADPTQYLGAQAGRLVILDEIQRMPGLFQVAMTAFPSAKTGLPSHWQPSWSAWRGWTE